MNGNIDEYIDFKQRVSQLNFSLPKTLCFLPENIDEAVDVSDFIFPEEAQTVSKLFKTNNIPEEKLSTASVKYRQRRSIDWFAPTELCTPFVKIVKNKASMPIYIGSFCKLR